MSEARNVSRSGIPGCKANANAISPERMAKVAFVAGLRGEELRVTADGLSAQEALDVLESSLVSRPVRIALVSRLCDADLLIRIATSTCETFIRRDALERLDAIQSKAPLTRKQLERLIPCLSDGDLLPATLELMEAAEFDWCAHCDETVAGAMCHALYNCQGIKDEVVVDDAFAQLAHCRPDLAPSLRKCSPERFLPVALQPTETRTIAIPRIVRRDDVA